MPVIARVTMMALAASLPLSYDAADQGRVTRGAALALEARMQLYQGDYTDAATTAQSVMNLGVYSVDQSGFLSVFDGFATSAIELANTTSPSSLG